MNNIQPIRSYEDLKQERERLRELLRVQKAQIQKDLQGIREEFRPITMISEVVGKIMHREDGKNGLISTGANITIDLLASKFLSKSNFLTKLILPALFKNVTSHYLPKTPTPQKRSPQTQPV